MDDQEGMHPKLFLPMAVIEATAGIAAILWGDAWFPVLAVPIPVAFGLTHAKIIGIVFLCIAAPLTLFFYYLRRREWAEKASASTHPVQKL